MSLFFRLLQFKLCDRPAAEWSTEETLLCIRISEQIALSLCPALADDFIHHERRCVGGVQ